jgi:hypothetical protein
MPTDPNRRPAVLVLVVVAALVVVSLAALVLGPPRSARTLAGVLPPKGAYFGAYAGGAGGPRAAFERLEAQVGRPLSIDHQYYQWNADIPTAQQEWDARTGTIPLVNWKAGVPWSAIASGEQDGWVRERADAFRAFGAPIALAFHHEPENDVARFGSPGDYAAAFRQVVDVFREEGALNVVFVWTMMSSTFDQHAGRDPDAFYPGDAYVDVVGADGFNWYPGKPRSRWTSFRDIFRSVNDFAAAHGKRWMAVEYGCQEDPTDPGRKAAWLLDALATAKTWPLLKGLVYFDVDKAYDWRTESSPASAAAFRRMAADPYFVRPPGG